MSLENKLINDLKEQRYIPLERALLIVAGLKTEKEIKRYICKIERIQNHFKTYFDGLPGDIKDSYSKAKLLFDFFWETKPNRFKGHLLFTDAVSSGSENDWLEECLDPALFQLTDVIDAQLSESKAESVGNCLGLTSLYTVIGLREGLSLSIISTASHVKGLLREDDKDIIIENTIRNGFVCGKREVYTEDPVYDLVAITILNRGLAKYSSGDRAGFFKDCAKALELKPGYSFVFYNLGIAKYRQGELEESIENYTKAIEIQPDYSKAFNNRGVAREDNGDFEGALKDFTQALKIDPDYTLAFYNRELVKEKLYDLEM